MIEERNKSFNDDFKKYDTFVENSKYLNNLRDRYTAIHESIQNEIKPHLKILEKNDFIKKGDVFGEYELTEMGKMASNINEIHCLAISDLIFNEKAFSNLNVMELVSVLSSFVIYVCPMIIRFIPLIMFLLMIKLRLRSRKLNPCIINITMKKPHTKQTLCLITKFNMI